MSDALQQAKVAVKTGDLSRGRQLLTEILEADPGNDHAWVWLSRAVDNDTRRRACLDRALAINPDNQEAQQAMLEWLLTDGQQPAAPSVSGTPSRPVRPAPATASQPDQPTLAFVPTPGASLQDFLLQLNKNYQILKEREAKYGGTAAPLDLLNQLDDYEHAIALTEEAIARAAPLEELQSQFYSLNLQISTVVFIAQEPPRKPFLGQNPYRGLRKFTEDDARFFFGRNDAIQSLLNTVQYLLETETSQQAPDLLAVLGPSGSGKSSLVRAGLIPVLRSGRLSINGGSHQWPIKVMLPGPHPLNALAETFVGEGGWDLATVRQILAGGEKALHDLMVEALATSGKSAETIFVLVIDQFEELFTLCEDEAERRAFIDQLLYASQTGRNRGLIVLTMRSDFYSKVATYKPLAEAVTQHQMLISPMTEKELREAILLPAETVGLELEKALVETLLKDTADAPGVLPLLQHALLELFHRRDGNLLTLEAYNEIGGVKGALAHRADSVINELTAAQQQITRRIFMRLVRPGEGAADTRRRATFEEVLTGDTEPQQVEAVVKTLADANLIITSRNPETDQVVLDVSHEALIQEWPLLRHWLNENRVGLRIQQQLSQAAKEWEARGRDEDSLYRGARLLEVEEWVEANPDEINPLEQAFINASVAARERVAAEKEAHRQRELAQAQALAKEQHQRAEEQAQAAARLRRQRLGLVGAGFIALVLAVVAVGFGMSSSRNATIASENADLAATRAAESQENANIAATREAEAVQAQAEAEQQARRALAGQLAAQSRLGLDHQFDLALLTSLTAYDLLESGQISDKVEAESSILAAVNKFPHLVTFLHGHGSPVWSLAVSPDGQTLAAGNSVGEVGLWDLGNRRPLRQLTGHQDQITSVVFSPDGRTLASGSGDKTIILWDVTSQQQLRQLKGHEEAVSTLAFSPDGQVLASGSDDSTIILWDVATGQPMGEPLSGHEGRVDAVAFSPDGQVLASGSEDSTIILWDVSTGQPMGEPLSGHEDEVTSLAFDPTGRLLASGGADQTVVLWDVSTDPPGSRTLIGHSDYVLAVTFSPDGQTLASGGAEGAIILWDVASGQPLGDPITGHGSDVTSVVFLDNQSFVSSSDDGSIILWNTVGDPPLGRFLAQEDSGILSLAFNFDGRVLAAAGRENNIYLWDVNTGAQIRQLSGHEDWVNSLAFSPTEPILASASDDGSVRLWDISTSEPIGEPLTGHNGSVLAVAFSPDGQTLASGGDDEVIILWDVATGQPRGEPLIGHAGAILSVAFSPDGQLLASGSVDTGIILWDVASGTPLGEPLHGHNDSVNSVAFSPDGQLLASGSEDSSIKLWDLSRQPPQAEPLVGHNNSVHQVAFSPDGQMLVSTSFDKSVILWDVVTRKRLGDPLTGHGDVVDGLAFSPDGKIVASGSYNGTIFLWDVDFASWQALACRRANRNMTQAEWEQLVGPSIPYRQICPDLPPG
jgi:WD40 repeat protein